MESLLTYLRSLPDGLIYIMLGISAFVENVFPPIPGDTITAFGAFLVGVGRLNFFGVYVSTTIGSLLGFMSLFRIGHYLGRRFFIERDYRFFKLKDIIKAEEWFMKYGYFLIVLNRFFPGIRSAISISAGILRLNVIKVTILAFLSCAVWNIIWIFAGYSLGAHWKTFEARMSAILARYNMAVLVLFVLAVVFFIVRKIFKAKKS